MVDAVANSIPDPVCLAEQPGRCDEYERSQYDQESYGDEPAHQITSKRIRLFTLHAVIIPHSSRMNDGLWDYRGQMGEKQAD